MKKTITDLTINDVVYKFQGTADVISLPVYSITKKELAIGSSGSYLFKMEHPDLTRFRFEDDRYKYEFFINKIDALKRRREAIDNHLKDIFSRQQDFLKSIEFITELSRKCDLEILEEIKKN